MRRRGRAAGALVVASATLAFGLAATTATATTATTAAAVGVSPDDIVYEHEISGLFDGRVLVPAGTTSEDFFVRNTADESGHLRLVLADVTASDPLLLDALTVTAQALGSAGAPVSLAAADPCAQLLTGPVLEAGESARVRTEIALGDLSGIEAQAETMSFTVQVVLSQAPVDSDACAGRTTPPTPRPTTPPTDPAAPADPDLDDGLLGTTGGTVPLLVLAGGAGLAVMGVALLLRRGREGTG